MKNILRYRPEIDGLRAIAVLAVIFHHADFLGFSGGFIGVDVFFVISGFLITSLLVGEHDKNQFSILQFYERRARRILPALSIVLASTVVFSFYAMTMAQIKELGQSLIAVSLFASNILLWRSGSYFDPISEEIPLLHTWSLGVEEQFYILFPLLLLGLWRFRKNKIFWVFAFGAILSLGLAEWGWRHKPMANFYLLPTRAWELLMGAMLALPSSQIALRNYIRPKLRAILAGIGMLGILAPICLFDPSTPFPSLYALAPTLGAVLLIAFADQNNLMGRLLAHKFMVGIGLISYSAYLWHQPLFAFARILTLDHVTPMIFMGLILITLGLAFLTWKYIETPFRQKSHFSQKQIFIGALIAAMVLIGVGHAMHRQHDPMAADFRPNPGFHISCDAKGLFSPNHDCMNDTAPNMLIWGDSIAMPLVRGFLADKPDLKIAQATRSSCGPFLNIGPLSIKKRLNSINARECIAFNDSVFDYLKKQTSIKTVILSSLMEQYVSDGKIFTRHGKTSGGENISPQNLAIRIGDTIRAIRQAGKKVIIFAPPPITDKNTATCHQRHMAGKPIWTSNKSCDFDRATYHAQKQKVIELLQTIEKTQDITVIWFDDVICNQTTCHSALNNVPLYRDVTHFSYGGSRYLGKKMGFLKLVVDKAR